MKSFESYVGYERVDNASEYNYDKNRYLDAIASLFHLQAPVTACIKYEDILYISYNKSAQPVHIIRKGCIENLLINITDYDKDLLLLLYLVFNEDFAFTVSNNSSDLDLFIKQCDKDFNNTSLVLSELSKELKQLTKIYRNKIDKALSDFLACEKKTKEYGVFSKKTFIQDIISDKLSKNIDNKKSQWVNDDLLNLKNIIIKEKKQVNEDLTNLNNQIELIKTKFQSQEKVKDKEDINKLTELNYQLKNDSNNTKLQQIANQIDPSLKNLQTNIEWFYQDNFCIQIIENYKKIICLLDDYKPNMEDYNLESILRPMQDCYKLYFKYSKNGFDISQIHLLNNIKELHADTNIAITMRSANKEKSYIGVSKLTCGYCHEELKDYPHRGTHGICDEGWNYYLPTQENSGLEDFSQNSIKLKKVPKKRGFELVNQRKNLSCDLSLDDSISEQDQYYKILYNLKIKNLSISFINPFTGGLELKEEMLINKEKTCLAKFKPMLSIEKPIQPTGFINSFTGGLEFTESHDILSKNIDCSGKGSNVLDDFS